jgi:uncharacterized delta-60 repeat protein
MGRYFGFRDRLAPALFSAALAACSGGGDSPSVPGTFDRSFASEGLFQLSDPALDALATSARSVDIAPDGKLLVAGAAKPPSSGNSAYSLYARMRPDGGLDSGFAGSGLLQYAAEPFFGRREGLRALPAANGGTVLVEDSTFCFPSACIMADPSQITTRRVDATGAADSAFEATQSPLILKQALVEPEGTVLLLGMRPAGPRPLTVFSLERIGLDGRADAAFAQKALAASECGITPSYVVSSVGMARQPDGKLVVARQDVPPGIEDPLRPVCVFRLNRDGTLDASFNAGGRNVLTEPLVARGTIVTILPRGDGGNIVVLNFHRLQDNAAAVMFVWLAPDGQVDQTRGTFGIRIVNGVVRAAAAAIDGQGRVVVAGFRGGDPTAAWPFPWADYDPVIVRIRPDGEGDATFGTRGFGLSSLTLAGRPIQPNGVAIAPDGSIFVAGFIGLLSDPSRNVRTTFAVAKLRGS